MGLKFIESLIFTFGHSLVLNKIPFKVVEVADDSLFKDNLIMPEETGEFGLFGGSDPDFNRFYPDLKPEDLTPSEEDFIYPIYRALSMTVVYHWGPIDFSKPGVLKKSMNLLKGQTVYPNHDTAVGKELGIVLKTFWQEEYKTKSGIIVPAGINAMLMIDGKSNPKVARGINMNPPSIHSTSVGVTFSWEKSHLEMPDEEFAHKWGEMDKNGELIRKVVNDVRFYDEISLVPHGADKYAQKVNDEQEIINPGYTKKRMQAVGQPYYFFDFKNQTLHINNSSQNNENMEFNEFLVMLGYSDGQFKDAEALKAHLNSLSQAKTSLDGIIAVTGDKPLEFIQNLQNNQVTAEQTAILDAVQEAGGTDNIKNLVTQAETVLAETRKDAVKFYKLLHPDAKDDDKMIKLINEATAEPALTYLDQYKKEFEKNVPLACKDCGSQNVDRGSFQEDSGEGKKPKPLTNSEIREKYRSMPRGNASLVHGVGKQEEKK